MLQPIIENHSPPSLLRSSLSTLSNCGVVDFLFFAAADGGGGWVLPVVAGVLAGCGGMFLPGDRGLTPVSDGVPWVVQSAIYGSMFYDGFGGFFSGQESGVIVACDVSPGCPWHAVFEVFLSWFYLFLFARGVYSKNT